MNWLVAALGAIVFVELLLRLPVGAQARRLVGVGSRTRNVLRSSRISDHWKEKVLLRYARDLLRASLLLAALILLAVLPLLLVAALLQWSGAAATLTWLSSLPALLICTTVGVVWSLVRTKTANPPPAEPR